MKKLFPVVVSLFLLLTVSAALAEPFEFDRHRRRHDEPPPQKERTNTLKSGEALEPGQSLYSNNGEYELACRRDGNLVLYRRGKHIWDTNTDGKGVRNCLMQKDGNFVIYGRHDKPTWTSGTHNNPGAYLVVQDDGNVVIYKPEVAIWDSHTVRK